jgi:hypothetical protein
VVDLVSNTPEALANGVRVAGQHRLDSMSNYLRQICVVDASSPKMRDIAMTALVGADV